MIRAKDIVVLGVLFWWLLKDREETSVSLTQSCVGPDGDVIQVPLGDPCPPGYAITEYTNVGEVEPVCHCVTEPCEC